MDRLPPFISVSHLRILWRKFVARYWSVEESQYIIRLISGLLKTTRGRWVPTYGRPTWLAKTCVQSRLKRLPCRFILCGCPLEDLMRVGSTSSVVPCLSSYPSETISTLVCLISQFCRRLRSQILTAEVATWWAVWMVRRFLVTTARRNDPYIPWTARTWSMGVI